MKDTKNIKGYIYFILLLFLFLQFNQLKSQTLDTKGTDFWLAFPPNYHNYIQSEYDELSKGDSLFIFIRGEEDTRGTIVYHNTAGEEFSHSFRINETGLFTFKTTHHDFEVVGYNHSGEILEDDDERNFCERIAKNSFHITTDDEVTVLAHSQAVNTSEAFLVFPTDILNTDYTIMSYKSDGRGRVWDSVWVEEPESTPSQFLVLAVEDNTQISINSKSTFHRNGDSSLVITLNQGDVFLVQSKIKEYYLDADLSGTKVHSTKPVAVISGQQRAAIISRIAPVISRDFIVEQLVPDKYCGKRTLVTPFVRINDESGYTDIARVQIIYDNTELLINNKTEGIFNKGDIFETTLIGSFEVETSKPSISAIFKKSAMTFDSDDTSKRSDPLMLIVPSVEKFEKVYQIHSIQAHEIGITIDSTGTIPTGEFKKVFSNHYVTLVSDTNYLSDLRIDDLPVDVDLFENIINTSYSYANVEVEEGPHTLTGSEPFGAYVYGYGYANAYGYPAGMNFENSIFDVTDELNPESESSYIYPNPVLNKATISYYSSQISPAAIEIFNVLGERVYSVSTNSSQNGWNEHSADLSSLISGTYFYIVTCNTMIYHGKFQKL